MKSLWYRLLPDHTAVPCTLEESANELRQDRQVCVTHTGAVLISTVFLMLDHSFKGPPLLFETMAFDPARVGGEVRDRYSTWGGSLVGHRLLVARVMEAQKSFKRSRNPHKRPTYTQIMDKVFS